MFATAALGVAIGTAAPAAPRHRPFAEMRGGCSDFATDVAASRAALASGATRLVPALRPADPPHARVDLGRAYRVRLWPAALSPAAAREVPAGRDPSAAVGFVWFDAPAPGRYRVGFSRKRWIGLRDAAGAAVEAAAFEMQTGCRPLFKVVDFDLPAAGRYRLFLGAADRGSARFVVLRGDS